MKKHSFLAVLVLGLFLAAAFPVYAAGQNAFTLPLTVTWGQGGLSKGMTYRLTLKGTEEGTPMPEEGQKEYSLTLTQNEKISQLPEIIYQKPGDYRYVLELTREDGKQIVVYYLHVMAVNGENGELEVNTAIRGGETDGEKTDRITFVDEDQKDPGTSVRPAAPDKGENASQKTSRVKTGDDGRMAPWLNLLLVSVIAAVWGFSEKRKRTGRF